MTDVGRATDPRAVALVDLDLRNEIFPATLLKTIEVLGALPIGGRLEVIVNDPRSVAALPRAVREAGHQALEAVRVPGGFRIHIERAEGKEG
jgi:TusA-related sulfurtransferase